MITASHNPCEYNGIKIFQADGYKLPDELEEKIEAIILDGVTQPPVKIGADIGRIRSSEMPTFDYTRHLISTVEDIDFQATRLLLTALTVRQA